MDRALRRHAGRSRRTEDSHSLGDRVGMTGVRRWKRDAKRKSSRCHLERLLVHVSHATGQKSRASPKADPIRKLVRDGNSHDVAGERLVRVEGVQNRTIESKFSIPPNVLVTLPRSSNGGGLSDAIRVGSKVLSALCPGSSVREFDATPSPGGEPRFQTGRRALQEWDEGEDAAGERTEPGRLGVCGSSCLDSGRLGGSLRC